MHGPIECINITSVVKVYGNAPNRVVVVLYEVRGLQLSHQYGRGGARKLGVLNRKLEGSHCIPCPNRCENKHHAYCMFKKEGIFIELVIGCKN